MPFSFSAVLQLDCSALCWFLPSKCIKGHQHREARGLLPLLVVCVPFTHSWLSLGHHSNGGKWGNNWEHKIQPCSFCLLPSWAVEGRWDNSHCVNCFASCREISVGQAVPRQGQSTKVPQCAGRMGCAGAGSQGPLSRPCRKTMHGYLTV